MTGYQVLRKLAEGSAAEVFLACEERSPTRVVLEVIRPELTTDFEVYGRFLDEAKDRQSLIHPNLLRHLTSGCAPDGRLFAVSEPFLGEHLGSLLAANGPLAPADVVRLAIQMCDALEYLHQHRKVHGHLRPANVFLTKGEGGPTPKLVDTGLSLLRPGRSIVIPAAMVLVEPEYLAPERIRGRRATTLSDVYGLGVLMYETLTGKPPFTSLDSAITRRMHLETEPPMLPPGCERLAPIVMRCLAKNPARRFPTIAAVRQALTWYIGATPSQEMLAQAHAPSAHDIEISIADAEPVSSADLVVGAPLGELLGSYVLEDLLGQGGMGRVFLARHAKLGRRVALKVLRPELAADPSQLQRFFQEARAVNRVNHEHIVQIFDFVEEPREEGGRVYCVMEPLAGKSLKDMAAELPIPIARAVGIVRQVCGALQAAHDVGVVHRDVKPDNIFLVNRDDSGDFVKVLDFGIAKLEASAGEPVMARTRSGIVVGTPSYMAPEQAIGEEVDARADVYSLATVLYALLAGRRPFESGSLRSVLTRLITSPPPPLPATTTGGEPIPPALARIIDKCLAKKPEDRIQSMGELSAALAPFETLAATPPPEEVAAPSPEVTPQAEFAPVAVTAPPKGRSRTSRARRKAARWPWVATAALLVIAAFGLWNRFGGTAAESTPAPVPETAAPRASGGSTPPTVEAPVPAPPHAVAPALPAAPVRPESPPAAAPTEARTAAPEATAAPDPSGAGHAVSDPNGQAPKRAAAAKPVPAKKPAKATRRHAP